MTDAIRAIPEEPLRVSTAVVALHEGAHEITLTFEGRSVMIIAESAVVIGSTERQPGADKTKPY